MYRSDVQYAWSDDVAIAYQIVGDGPIDLIYMPPFVSNLDWQWEYPTHARYLERLASFSRLIVVDRRGWGLSDRVAPGSFPLLETAADDLIAVLDAIESPQAALFGGGEAGWIAMIAAASHPERFTSLILYQASATYMRTEETPWNVSLEENLAEEEFWMNAGTVSWARSWIREYEPSLAEDPAAAEYYAKLARGTIALGASIAEFRRYYTTDIRAILPAIRVPTLVLYRPDLQMSWTKNAPLLAAKIPHARLAALPGADYMPWAGETDALVDEVEEFITGVRPVRQPDRVLATVLFTDIVDSTKRAAELGDTAWKELVESHHARVRALLGRYRGREADTAGDGFFATFDGPARAVRCSQAIVEAIKPLRIEIRAGVHTGEVETINEKVGGIAVSIGARVAALAAPSEVLVSQTVKDLVAGSGLIFEDAGEHELKGVPDRWRLYRVVDD